MSTKDKRVSFFQIKFLTETGIARPGMDWRDALERVQALPIPERTHDGVIYDPHVTERSVLLGVHALIKPDFMTHIDPEGSIGDLMDAAESSGLARFANSTAVCFLPVANAVAVATGTNQSPKPPKVVVDFLERHLPQGAGVHWRCEPIMDTAKIREFTEQSQGVAAFSSTITTVRDVFTPDGSTGVVKFADQLAERIGGDVEIELRVRLAPQSRNRSAKQRLRDLLVSDLSRIVGNPKAKTKVTALLPNGVEEEMHLVAARLGTTIDVAQGVSESLRFSALLAHLEDVGAQMEDRVRELLEG